MIRNKKEYKHYLQSDLRAYGFEKMSIYIYFRMDCLRFIRRLRKIEYLYNCHRNNVFCNAYLFILELINQRVSIGLGFTIPKNVFGPGLCIVHHGTIVVSDKASVGKNCRIHPSTCIGDYNGAPSLGDNVYVGPGAKLFGAIKIGNNVVVGANSVVNKDFGDNITIAGVPARIISNKSSLQSDVYPKGFLETTT